MTHVNSCADARRSGRLFASRMGATAVEIPSGHVAMISHPDEVARLITTAASG